MTVIHIPALIDVWLFPFLSHTGVVKVILILDSVPVQQTVVFSVECLLSARVSIGNFMGVFGKESEVICSCVAFYYTLSIFNQTDKLSAVVFTSNRLRPNVVKN